MTLLDKWMVLIEMAADPDVSRGEFVAGMVLLDRMNANGIAQIGHATIAENTGQTTRSAKRATDGLIEKCYFEQVGQGGPGCPNRYRRRKPIRLATDGQPKNVGTPTSPQVGTPASPPKKAVGTSTSPYGDAHVPTVGTPASDIPSYPLLPKGEGPPTAPSAGNASDGSKQPKAAKVDRKKPPTLIPENWQPNAMGVSFAEQKAGWSLDRIRHETDKFKAHHEKVESRYSNWDAAWRQWVLHGLERDQQRPAGRPASPHTNGHDAGGESYAARQVRRLRAEAAAETAP